MTKLKYEVTDKAGDFLAGMRSPGMGKTIEMTEDEARYPLILGEIILPAAKAPAAKPVKE